MSGANFGMAWYGAGQMEAGLEEWCVKAVWRNSLVDHKISRYCSMQSVTFLRHWRKFFTAASCWDTVLGFRFIAEKKASASSFTVA